MKIGFRWPLYHEKYECYECGCHGHWRLRTPLYRFTPPSPMMLEVTAELLKYTMPPTTFAEAVHSRAEMWRADYGDTIQIPKIVSGTWAPGKSYTEGFDKDITAK